MHSRSTLLTKMAGELSEELSTELEALKAIYSTDGEFDEQSCNSTDAYLRIINLKPSNLSVGLQLSIPASYPSTCPKIEFIPVSLPTSGFQTEDDYSGPSDSTLAELLQHLYQVAKDNEGTAMMYLLVEAAKDWMMNREEMDATEQLAVTNPSKDTETTKEDTHNACNDDFDEEEYPSKRKNKKGANSRKKPPKEEKIKGKLPRMKTATEVIHRIIWDDQLCQDHFVVGYLDRFIGVIENAFTAFSWEDIASVDYDVLAIPKHRIQYFKYKDAIVWDKRVRLDNVFGSTGSDITIIGVIERYEKENRDVEEKESDDSTEADKSSEEEGERNSQATPMKRNSNRPNYFIAIRVSNPDIADQVQHVQTEICNLDETLESTRSSLRQLHVTLCTLRLDDPSEIERAIDVLKEQQHEFKSLLAPATILRFQGLQTFHNRVLCSVPEYNPMVVKLSDHLCSAMDNAGLRVIETPHSFTPHLTILKITRKQIKLGQRDRDYNIYKDHIETNFGVQNVDFIHLCSMRDAPRADGFYYSLASVDVLPEN